MLSLKQRLLSAEDDFLAALISGEDAVSDFNTRWDALVEDLNAVLESGLLDPDLSTLAHSTAIRVATLADTSIDVLTSCDSVTSELMCQLNGLMSELVLEDPSPNGHPTPPAALLESLYAPSSDSVVGHASRKRRISSSSDDWVDDTAQKRTCRRQSTMLASASYSRRYVETSGPPAVAPPEASEVANVGLPISPPRTSRKRRLSDAEPSPMKSKRLHVGPRLHAVSDSFVHSRNTHTKLRAQTVTVRDGSLPVPNNRLGVRYVQTPSPITIGSLLGSYTDVSPSQTALPELVGFDDLLRSLIDDSIPTIPLPTNQLRIASQLGGDDVSNDQPLPPPSSDEQPSTMPSLSSVPIPVPSASITPLTPPSDRPVEPVFDDDFSPYSSAALPPDDPWQPFVPLFESFDYGSPCSSPQSSQSSLSSPFLPGTPPLPLPRDHHDPMIPALQNAMTLHASKSSHPTISVHESPSPSDHFDIGALFNSSFNVDPVVQSLDDSWSAWFETFDAHSTPSRSSPPCSYDPLELPWESHTVSVIELKRPNVTVDPLLQVPDYLSSSH